MSTVSRSVPSVKALMPYGLPSRKRRPTKPNPRDNWPAWTDRDTWSPAAEPIDTTDYGTPFQPSPISEAWDAGFRLGYEHVDAMPPAELSEGLRFHWHVGHNTGWLRRESDDLLIDLAERRHREPGEIRETDIYPAGATS